MGLLDFISRQSVDGIDWAEAHDIVLAWRFPMADREIQPRSRLTVRDARVALFVHEGVIADTFGPGVHTLDAKSLPLLANLIGGDNATLEAPFASDVFFFSTHDQADQKWSTPQPLAIRDKEIGPMRLRTFGTFAYRIIDPRVFYQKISGSRDKYTAVELEGQLRGVVTAQLATYFASAPVAFVELTMNQTAFSQKLLASIAPAFLSYGMELRSFVVEGLVLPDDLQPRFDRLASQDVLGDLGHYLKFEPAESMPPAAPMPVGLSVPVPGAPCALVTADMDETLALIEKLHGLLEKGVLTEHEFQAKKQELLQKFK